MEVSKAGTDTSPDLFVLRREGRTRPGSFTSPVQICRDGFSGSRSRASADPERTVEEVSPRRQWLCQRVRPPHALAGELVQEGSLYLMLLCVSVQTDTILIHVFVGDYHDKITTPKKALFEVYCQICHQVLFSNPFE